MALDWLPIVPDRLPRPPTLRSRWPSFFWLPYSRLVYPPPDILATRGWQPSYPDRARRLLPSLTRDRTWITSAALTEVAASAPARWFPLYPARVSRYHPSRAEGSSVAAPPAVQIVIAQSLAWRAAFPDSAARARHRQTADATYTIPPSVAAAAILCVELGLETWAASGILSETVTTPGLLNEAVTVTGLTAEAVC